MNIRVPLKSRTLLNRLNGSHPSPAAVSFPPMDSPCFEEECKDDCPFKSLIIFDLFDWEFFLSLEQLLPDFCFFVFLCSCRLLTLFTSIYLGKDVDGMSQVMSDTPSAAPLLPQGPPSWIDQWCRTGGMPCCWLQWLQREPTCYF